jgi:hypothetical protein
MPLFTEAAPGSDELADQKLDVNAKVAPKAKPSNAKAPTAKSSAPAKKASMTSKKGV